MAIAKRILLFLAVNILIVLTVSTILNFFGVQPYLTRYGMDYRSLAIFCLVWGMVGSFISLLLSKVMAKWMMGVQTIDPINCSYEHRELVRMVENLSRNAGLTSVPEVGIFESEEINAFATGPSQRYSLVAVSSGMLKKMSPMEIEGVVGHEIAHIANGDMVTMTLLQGVLNAFVMFLARAIAFAIMQVRSGSSESENEESSSGNAISSIAYTLIVFVLEIVFMILASIVISWFSRYREFRADEGGASIAGRPKMIAALEALKRHYEDPVAETATPINQSIKAMMISGKKGGFAHLFASHPPLETRIDRLKGKA